MRAEARHLDEDQKKINEQLEAWEKNPERTLRESDERKQVRQGAEQQAKKLDEMLDRMRKTTQEAEETEPLLAKGLYDTVRQANEQKVPEALKATQQLVDAGIPDEASKAARIAGQGIEELRKGIDHAAESVLGDDTAALRRAQGELDDLADQVNREIARNNRPNNPQGRDGPNEANRPEHGHEAGTPKADQQARGPGAGQQPQPGDPNRQGRRDPQQGQAPGQRDQQGQAPGQGDQQQGQTPGGRRQGQQGQPKGQGQGQQQQGEGQQQGQAGEQANPGGQPGGGQQQGRGGNRQAPGQRDQQGREGGQRASAASRGGQGGNQANRGLEQVAEGMNGGRGGAPGGPITGEGFRQWSDRMRDVEELLDDPEWRAEAAQVRDRVRGAREEFRRHAKEPDWNQLQGLVTRPINELRQRIGEELRRRESPDALVPIDRDPVPPQFAEGVRRYYERLGSGH